MKKIDFVKAVQAGCKEKNIQLNIAEVGTVIDVVSDVILDVISKDDSVKLGEVCTFKGVDRPARVARNPRTGEDINVPAKTGYPACKFTKAAKE